MLKALQLRVMNRHLGTKGLRTEGLCLRDGALSFPKSNDIFSIIKATTGKERGGRGWGVDLR